MQIMTFCKVFSDVKEIPEYVDDIWLMEVTDFCKEFNYHLHDVQLNTTNLDKSILITALYKVMP